MSDDRSVIYKLDGKPPLSIAIPLGLQHVLAMFIGNIAPIIVIAGIPSAGIGPEMRTQMIQGAMLVAGIVTMFQLYPIPLGKNFAIGARLPIVVGTSFAFMPASIAATTVINPATGEPVGIYGVLGAALVGSIAAILFGLFIKPLSKFFPSLVTGVVLIAIGMNLMPVGAKYFVGGLGKAQFKNETITTFMKETITADKKDAAGNLVTEPLKNPKGEPVNKADGTPVMVASQVPILSKDGQPIQGMVKKEVVNGTYVAYKYDKATKAVVPVSTVMTFSNIAFHPKNQSSLLTSTVIKEVSLEPNAVDAANRPIKKPVLKDGKPVMVDVVKKPVINGFVTINAYDPVSKMVYDKSVKVLPVPENVIENVTSDNHSIITNKGDANTPKGTLANGYFGDPMNFLLAFIVLMVVVILQTYTKGAANLSSVLIALIVGYIVAFFMGKVDFSGITTASMFAIPMPIDFGKLYFDTGSIIKFAAVYIVVALETIGNLSGITLAGENREATPKEMSGAILCDGVGSAIASMFGILPNTAYGQNAGIVAMTKVMNRFCVATGALFLVVAGLFPKFAAIFSAMPQAVLGGAVVSVFAMIFISGIKMVMRDGLTSRDTTILALAIGVGIGLSRPLTGTTFDQVVVQNANGTLEAVGVINNAGLPPEHGIIPAYTPFEHLPYAIKFILEDSIICSALIAIVLNAIFPKPSQAERDAAKASSTAH